MKEKTNIKKGFSLVELLVVVGIFVLMTAVLFTSLKKNQGSQDVEIAARQITASLRSLQNDALNGKLVGTKKACSFSLVGYNGNNRYDIKYYECDSPSTVISTAAFYLKNANFSGSGASPSVTYAAPQGSVSTASLLPNNKITIISTKDNTNRMTICINASGNILEQKGDVGC